ncbi:mesoderm induction early response protein [Rhynchospora pubera]|uniref:Mesoderm induction early response protein n=1 Tax=Rhynchospora pubera TaxID=906938 RepID=A0AAV8EAH3_9POAL|nr:mesoderm induction early response protein [Rhynchospora pubera]
MEENDKGNDWEVVSLTASTYAAAPGPQIPTMLPSEDRKLDTSYTTKQYDFESPSSMFMSGHFLLPKEKEIDESSKFEETETSKAKEDDLQKSLSMSSGFESHVGSIAEESETPEMDEQKSDVEQEEDNQTKGLEREGWWKKQALTLYKNMKEATTLWSVFWAAALVGIAIVGQRWQREKLQIQQLKLQFRINNERISCMVVPFRSTSLTGNAHNHLVHDYATLG